ncbi:TolC family outer membrane protein [Thiosocius teredinicola]|uniref:TolC family outer membrane protein n=1 Tax=Thiosocius teredinicola TaxID=1973002 RepID=UPI0013DDE23C
MCVLVGWSSAQAQQGALTDVVRSALTTNPDVAEARNQWLARREEVRQAEGGYLPSIDLNAGFGHEHTDNPTTRANDGHTNDLERRELGLTVRQMLFDGWGTSSEVDRQNARMNSAAARLMSVGESTAMKAVQAYVDLNRYQQLQDISQQSLDIHRRIEEQIRARSDAGVGRRADFDQVTSRVALSEVNLVAADVNVQDAQTTFYRVVGAAPAESYPAADPVGDALPGSLEQAMEIAQANNPVLQTASADIEAAKAQHEASKQFFYPRFDLEVGGNLNDNIGGVEGHDNDATAMIRMRYNLFRGGADAARKRATAYNINEAKDVRDRSVRQLEESIRLAWAALEATRAQLPLLERQVEAARATRDAYGKQFRIGQRTLLDLLNSENEVLTAQQAIVETQADHLLAQYRLLEALGVLIDKVDAADALAMEPQAGQTPAQ